MLVGGIGFGWHNQHQSQPLSCMKTAENLQLNIPLLKDSSTEVHPIRETLCTARAVQPYHQCTGSNVSSYTYIFASERMISSSRSERVSPFLTRHHVLLTRTSWKSVCWGSSGAAAAAIGTKPSSDNGMFLGKSNLC